MWRRIADVLLHKPSPPDDERSTNERRLNGLEREVKETNARIRAIAIEARVAAYGRVRIGR